MNSERKYYESEVFWNSSLLLDDQNQKRLFCTSAMVPEEVGTLLDAGCGNGLFVNHLTSHRPFIRITCFDRSEKALSFVRATKTLGSLDAIPFPNRSFDCVTCLEVIEHLPFGVYERALKELARVSARYVLISVPRAENVAQNQTQCPKCFARFNADLHLRSFNRDIMQTLLPGFTARRTEVFVPFKRFIGAHLYYRHLARYVFNSPICPVCSWSNPDFKPKAALEGAAFEPGGRLAALKGALKTLWPRKVDPGFWIATLYERER